MKVYYKTILYGYSTPTDSVCRHTKGDVREKVLLEEEYCCEEMREAFSEKFIGFGEFEGLLNEEAVICIYNCSPYPEGACWDEMPIKVCPFCGEKITLIESQKKYLVQKKKKKTETFMDSVEVDSI